MVPFWIFDRDDWTIEDVGSAVRWLGSRFFPFGRNTVSVDCLRLVCAKKWGAYFTKLGVRNYALFDMICKSSKDELEA